MPQVGGTGDRSGMGARGWPWRTARKFGAEPKRPTRAHIVTVSDQNPPKSPHSRHPPATRGDGGSTNATAGGPVTPPGSKEGLNANKRRWLQTAANAACRCGASPDPARQRRPRTRAGAAGRPFRPVHLRLFAVLCVHLRCIPSSAGRASTGFAIRAIRIVRLARANRAGGRRQQAVSWKATAVPIRVTRQSEMRGVMRVRAGPGKASATPVPCGLPAP